MRYLIFVCVLISAPIFAKAVSSDGCINCGLEVVGHPKDEKVVQELGDIRKIASLSEEVDYGVLGGKICALYVSSRDVTRDVKFAIYSFLKEREKMIDPTPADVLRMLNLHKNELTCDGGMHIINVAFQRGKYNEIVDELFNGDLVTDDYNLDFNAVTYHVMNPRTKEEIKVPMTVLDYIEQVALKTDSISGGETSTREIKELKNLIENDFGGLRFKDLPLSERQAFERTTASEKAF